jgi:hypothetical protein
MSGWCPPNELRSSVLSTSVEIGLPRHDRFETIAKLRQIKLDFAVATLSESNQSR